MTDTSDGNLARLTKSWSAPRELATSPPRPVRLSGSGIVLLVVALGMVAGGVVLGITLSGARTRQTERARLIAEQGAETDGTVTRLWRGGGKDRTFNVSYRFEAQGHVLDGTAKVSRKVWEGLSENSRLRVRYATSDLTLNQPADWNPQTTPAWLPLVIAGSFALIAVIPWWTLRRQRELLEDGRAAPGVITKVRRAKNGLSVRYDFLLPAGGKTSGSGTIRRGTGDTGSVITVVYDPENPHRNSPYPLELVRPGQ